VSTQERRFIERLDQLIQERRGRQAPREIPVT
jgi:hypothetical protein